MIRRIYKKIKNANADQLRRWRFVFWLSFGSVSLLGASLILLLGFRPTPEILANDLPLTLKVEKNTTLEAPLYAVMIDNALEARPQFGLNSAPIVIEAPVEGGYTRLMAIFDSASEVETIGPVRSVRPYFIELAKSFGAAVVHIGGSPEAMDQLKKYPLPNIDGIRGDCCFWRSKERFAPHNALTSSGSLKKGVSKNDAPLAVLAYGEINEVRDKDEKAQGAEIQFAKNIQPISWRYNVNLGAYIRSQGDEVLKDANDDKPILAENIAILKADIEVIDSQSRRSIVTTGRGEALFLIGGKLISGHWERKVDQALLFKNTQGEDISWHPGQIWIEIIDTNNVVNILK